MTFHAYLEAEVLLKAEKFLIVRESLEKFKGNCSVNVLLFVKNSC